MTRWFTSTKPGPLVVPYASFTAQERATVSAILQFATNPANGDQELMHCTDADGIRLIDQNTGHKQADLTALMKAAAKREAVRFWHNHPSQDSLSSHDWRLAACDNVEVLAINESGSMFVGRIDEWRDEFDVMLDKFSLVAGELYFVLYNAGTTAGLSSAELSSLDQRTGHVLNLAMSHCGIGLYAFDLSEADSIVYDKADRLGVVRKGLAYAERRINSVLTTATATLAN